MLLIQFEVFKNSPIPRLQSAVDVILVFVELWEEQSIRNLHVTKSSIVHTAQLYRT